MARRRAAREAPPAGKAAEIPDFAGRSAITNLAVASGEIAAAQALGAALLLVPNYVAITSRRFLGVERPALGRYGLVEELGRGAMGIVHKGLDPEINRTVAIKTVHSDDVEEAMPPQVKERFFREAQAAGGLNHPNILTIHDSGEEMDVAWIAMEFLAGRDPERCCKPDSLPPWSRVLEICARVADAQEYAHAHGIVHRDIKPANVMLLDSEGEFARTLRALKDRLDKALAQAGRAPSAEARRPRAAGPGAGGEAPQQFIGPPRPGGA